MEYQVDPRINWTWFKVRDGDLVSQFRLHHGPVCSAMYNYIKGGGWKETVLEGTWRDTKAIVANHTDYTEGYNLPEVVEKFKWLDDFFKRQADSVERVYCATEMSHLKYHGVSIFKVWRTC